MQKEGEIVIPFWGIRCQGCDLMHPTAMYREGDTIGRFQPEEAFKYRCPRDDKAYEYRGKDERVFDYRLVWQQ